MAKNFDELIRDIDLIIEHVDNLKNLSARDKQQSSNSAPPAEKPAYDSFSEIYALKAVMRAFISSVDTIVKVQIAHKVEQDIGHLENRVRSIGGDSAKAEDLAQITAYVRHAVSEMME
ncbi:hypothetical protein [Rouxiella badensis]|uniref:Uncharacterized protein n=1 Tax=Rouxiella badensis TaxID=1646377 RepID=A0A1X0WFT5_9GAMM|nr:hypothetical protein [Rouxiella badensis]MCC3704437.1 hypothetical protein [Rouxiella badensis]MCC3718526.1 hypothetical protein [Rouxiella badensis]MCC3726706.1 hypothetical protein [Rouxiella badensis]MCC3735350.1 hypothetical protein [Rouxiella badensis]MCC3738944.1 hypothetical protein [Rouxiella badensis]